MNIRTTCPGCGDVEVTGDDIRLVTFAKKPAQNFYAFTCTGCSERVSKHADFQVILAIKDHVQWEKVDIPAEALEIHKGGPLTANEVLDFVNDVLKYL